jgi:hypothetical protein
MKITPSVIVGVSFAVLLLIVVLRVWVKGGMLPPHEFAYGATQDSQMVPEKRASRQLAFRCRATFRESDLSGVAAVLQPGHHANSATAAGRYASIAD